MNTASLLATVGLLAACPSSEAHRPAPAAPPPPSSLAAPAQPQTAPEPAAEAGKVSLSTAFLVGGEMEQTVRDQITDQVVRAIHASTAAFRKCYAPALERNPSLAGEFDVELVIQAGGGLAKLQAEQDALPDPELVACVLSVFQRMALPAPPAHYRMIAPMQFAPQ